MACADNSFAKIAKMMDMLEDAGIEMVFGMAAAVVVGFLYTAAFNWTGLWTPVRGKLAALVFTGLAALGTWQVQRLFWKLDLIERVDCTPDTVNGFRYMHEAYTATDPKYTGKVTVPTLWDRKTGRIVSNESADIIRMFNSAFDGITGNLLDLYPEDLRPEIDRWNDYIYPKLNNGVYRSGFASSQQAYAQARGLVILFGGAGNDSLRGDTWSWDGTEWRRLATTGRSEADCRPACEHWLIWSRLSPRPRTHRRCRAAPRLARAPPCPSAAGSPRSSRTRAAPAAPSPLASPGPRRRRC